MLSLIWISIRLEKIHAENPVLQLNLESVTKSSYSRFIQQLRTLAIVDGKMYEGVWMLPKPNNIENYIIVNISTLRGHSLIHIDVGINKNNLYVVGYREDSGRAHFFSGAPENAQYLFQGQVSKRYQIRFGSDYVSLEATAHVSRSILSPSFDKLRDQLLRVYALDVKNRNFHYYQANLVLLLTQIISEAARFKYVQSMVINDGPIPNYKLPVLENNWRTISRRFKNSVKKTIRPPLELSYPNNSRWEVTQVGQLKNDLGVLTYVE
ncbi:antiviral protein alpha [Beta vulgaris subsp. vulgaris]|uniref:antiviral protein alpha n=1 Tax=Beta vulgaris subsp. vulgaris TaxID=3555 RepID=UPI002036E0FA|nr:antiviral protein alpha [Beta vulgaris subsp. vulgaris]